VPNIVYLSPLLIFVRLLAVSFFDAVVSFGVSSVLQVTDIRMRLKGEN
jgi:hypothetical protein